MVRIFMRRIVALADQAIGFAARSSALHNGRSAGRVLQIVKSDERDGQDHGGNQERTHCLHAIPPLCGPEKKQECRDHGDNRKLKNMRCGTFVRSRRLPIAAVQVSAQYST